MDKNLLLAVLGGVALVVAGALVLFSPDIIQDSIHAKTGAKINFSKGKNQTFIQIQKNFNSSSSLSINKQIKKIKKKNKEKNFSELAFLSEGNRYKMIIKSNILPSLQHYHLRTIEGIINNKRIILKLPEELSNDPQTKVIIQNMQNGKQIAVNNAFLQQLPTLNSNEHLIININTESPDDMFISSRKIISILPGPNQ